MSNVYCNKCGSPNPLGSNFCSKCGTPLSTQAKKIIAAPKEVEEAEEVVETEETPSVPHLTELKADIFIPNTKVKMEDVVGSDPDPNFRMSRRKPVKKYPKNKAKFFKELEKEFVLNRNEDVDFEKEAD